MTAAATTDRSAGDQGAVQIAVPAGASDRRYQR
jgi:hypothetical protein